jgi:hypothetical protein
MGLSQVLRVLTPLVLLPLIASCAGVTYREQATVFQSRHATVENFGDEEITAEQVDGLLEEVAEILGVGLSPNKPKIRIMVTSPSRIADLYRRVMTVATHGANAMALYFPGANLVMIPSYDRAILGHELAHYLTDHYLKSTPRRSWERIALKVEDALLATPRKVARRSPVAPVPVTQTARVPLAAPAY